MKKVREGELLKRWLLESYLERNVKGIYKVIHASNYNKCFFQFPVDNYTIMILHQRNANLIFTVAGKDMSLELIKFM